MNKKMTVTLSMMIVAALTMTTVGLASMLPISSAAAMKVIDIIDAGSTIATIVSLVAAVVGAGVVSTGIIATAKALIKKYGKKYAAAW
ncbi:circularin A/uberolysin family circular bacteriocin [Lachnospiraceae bacterium 3-1]|nr:circularin A/uberolysin family circular bacteriocin [Lachnospiraceae bacterium 3-1]